MTARRLAALALGLCVAMVLMGCGAGRTGPVAAPSPPSVPGEATGGPDLTGVKLPDFTMPLIKGGVSRPKPSLTPGAVVSTDTTALCALPDHTGGSSIPMATQLAVFTAYGITNPQVQSKYQMNYLVPILLGGATTTTNIWPAAIKGTGFFQKGQLDHVLRDLVCRRTISITTAQSDLEKNWYATWLQYVVATGRA
jgi:hypothetical protein